MFKVTLRYSNKILVLGTRLECAEYVAGSYQPFAFAITEVK